MIVDGRLGGSSDEADLEIIRALISDDSGLNGRSGLPIGEKADEGDGHVGGWWMVCLVDGIDAVTAGASAYLTGLKCQPIPFADHPGVVGIGELPGKGAPGGDKRSHGTVGTKLG